MADQYFIENEALYRLTAPRNKKQDRLRTHDVRLCHIHMTSLATSMTGLDTEVQRLFDIVERLYWNNLYTDRCQFILTGAIARMTIDAG